VFVKLILPALLEAKDPGFRPIKYALFPPLGLAALAGYLDDEDQVVFEDEHIMALTTDDRPDLVVMSVYITSVYCTYQLADHYRRRGSHVALGGLHVTALPDEAARNADTVFSGPGRTPGRASSPTSGVERPWPATSRRSARCWVPRRCGLT
jgi:radical SAM superfamily enzyme YgiQ (UPF0313 family)